MTDHPFAERIDINGVNVAFRRKGSGPPLLFINGMGLTRRWLNVFDALADRFDVITPDNPGFGDTPRPAWYRTLDDLLPHHADFLTALDVEQAHIVGHSLGGLIAGAFAATYPERVASLTLLAPMAMPVVSPSELQGGHEGPPPDDIMAMLFNDNQAAYPEYDSPADLGLLVAAADDDLADPAAWKLDVAPGLYRRLSRITAPSQVVVPDEDRTIPKSVFDTWSRWLGDAPLVRISGQRHPTGHLLLVQEPQAVADQIAALALAC